MTLDMEELGREVNALVQAKEKMHLIDGKLMQQRQMQIELDAQASIAAHDNALRDKDTAMLELERRRILLQMAEECDLQAKRDEASPAKRRKTWDDDEAPPAKRQKTRDDCEVIKNAKEYCARMLSKRDGTRRIRPARS
jgi:hypothetical protein